MIYKILSSGIANPMIFDFVPNNIGGLAPRYCFANPMILDFALDNIGGLANQYHGVGGAVGDAVIPLVDDDSKASIMRLYTS